VEEKGEWVELERQDYNYFIKSFNEKTVPFTIRVTASNNQVIEDEIVAIVPETTQQSSKQFGNQASSNMISVLLVVIAICAQLVLM
jgi:expansin (peptidoglycan-binding protein)